MGSRRNTQLLTSAKKHGKNLKAIAVTGTINTITTGDPADLKSRIISSDKWLPVSDQEMHESGRSC